MKSFWTTLLALACLGAVAAEVIPPAPKLYFNDYAHVVSPSTAQQLNQKLEDFERVSSDQVVVAVFPKMESDSSVEDYTVQVARAWKVGQALHNNGVVLFVFVQDHKMFIQVGYGLEGALPDALCKRIIEEQIAPRFRAGDFDGGLTAGVEGIIAATRGEYKGTGRTVGDNARNSRGHAGPLATVLLVIVLIVIAALRRMANPRRGFLYHPYGRSAWLGSSWGGGGGWSGGSGGGFSGGGGGGFSGGGGSFGGGGAGGGW